MAAPTLIYCADGNPRYAQIAIDAGFLYGAQLPNKIYFDPYFVDQNWKKPDRERYIAALAQHRPHIASVIDWEHEEQLDEVLSWAEEVAQFVGVVVLIPKVQGGIARLPREIGGKQVRLGYSVPTRFSGTELPAWEFIGWPVHLLGGSPHAQINLSFYLRVDSVDGNMHTKMANKNCLFWSMKKGPNGHWNSIEKTDGERWNETADVADAPYEAFRRSCKNIMNAWHKLYERR